jgi:L-rhamnose isomerase
VGTWVHDFSNFPGRGNLYLPTVVGTWVRGYTTFQTFLAGGIYTCGGYVGTWVHDFSNFPGRGNLIMSQGRGYVGTWVHRFQNVLAGGILS